MPTVIITGAGTGIGAATAKRLAAAGWGTALVGRRAELLQQIATEIKKAGGRATPLSFDLSDAAAAKAVVQQTREIFGGVDALVNNAAVIRVLPIAEFTTDTLDQHWAVNIRAPFLLIQAALPFLQRKGGSVVNISSSSGTLLRPGQSVYGMTKAALEYF